MACLIIVSLQVLDRTWSLTTLKLRFSFLFLCHNLFYNIAVGHKAETKDEKSNTTNAHLKVTTIFFADETF